MSTTFEVYPTSSYVPRITELLALANQKLQNFLQPFELKTAPVISARIGETIVHTNSSTFLNAQWEEEYAWFFVNDADGGTDAYYSIVNDLDVEIWTEYQDSGLRYTKVLHALSIGYYWSFRRSSGQPAMINVAYGFLAAAMAELTGGFLFSDDGAWTGDPSLASEFEGRYFNPAKANNYGDALWYARCLQSLIEEYGGKQYDPGITLLTEHEWEDNRRLTYAPSGRTMGEGPAKGDTLLILHSEYLNYPYAIINRSLVKPDEPALIRILRLTDVRRVLDLSGQPVHSVQEIDLKPLLMNPELTFWYNPVLGKNGENIFRQLTEA
ncbi:hypothetical protein C2I18_23480 [Paenibacillus sp. PK3_47]|uniref:hypothetical protein n=1 Tax=Paenibacillus sp. PK3_47 TaxID=2072642 RepID=UPI00201D775C|nr:hypothetical protein [Paenibacillus sp. PK3_47]UQZ36222.1 hypothetical protein C2I18_23480 [Paenibacillus sp. PK3_47]